MTNGVWNGSSWLAQSQYGYDAASRLALVTQPSTLNPQLSVGYSYLANSPLVEYVYFTNGSSRVMTTTKTFDGLNRLTGIATRDAQQNPLASFGYQLNSANQRMGITNADSSRWAYQYDSLGQVTSGKKYWDDNSLEAGQQFEYDFDHIGNRNWTKAGGNSSGGDLRQAFYTNNALNQITGRTVPGVVDILGAATNTATVSVNDQAVYRKGEYFWKELTINNSTGAAWQGVTVAAVKKGATTNDSDLMLTNRGSVFLPKTPETFGYDADGNLTQNGRWNFAWDGENRLTSMEALSSLPAPARQKLTFTYDYQWRRTSKVVSNWTGSAWTKASEQRFIYDGWNLMAILDESLSLKYSFTWGLDLSGSLQGAGGVGGLLAMTMHSGANAGTYFPAYDGNGNIVAYVNASTGTKAAEFEYAPFGELIRATGPLARECVFLFSTKFYDWETGLYYYGYRYYDPIPGRWPSRDPIQEIVSISLYRFAVNSPLAYVDRSGLDSYPLVKAAPAPPSTMFPPTYKPFPPGFPGPQVPTGPLIPAAGAGGTAGAGTALGQSVTAFFMLIPGASFAWLYVNPPPSSVYYPSALSNGQNAPPSIVYVSPNGTPSSVPINSAGWSSVPTKPPGNPLPATPASEVLPPVYISMPEEWNPTGSPYANTLFQCDKFANSAIEYFKACKGKQAKCIKYASLQNMTVADTIGALGGLYQGQTISKTGTHWGAVLDGIVYDSNVPWGVAQNSWEQLYYVIHWPSYKEMTLGWAAANNIGTITIQDPPCK